MFRLLLTGLAVYFGYHLVKGFFSGPSKKASNVRGKQKSQPLDLRDADVQDAEFEDIDEKGE